MATLASLAYNMRDDMSIIFSQQIIDGLVVIGSNLNLLLKLLFYPTNNNL